MAWSIVGDGSIIRPPVIRQGKKRRTTIAVPDAEQTICATRFLIESEATMAVNKPKGDNARKGAVKKRTQLATKTMGKKTWTKRDKTSGEFMDQKKAPAKKKFKGVRREK